MRKRLTEDDITKLGWRIVGDNKANKTVSKVSAPVVKESGLDKRKRAKYGNKMTIVDGIVFASKREATKYEELKLRQLAGEIHNLELQVRFPLIVNEIKVATYVADFVYMENGKRVVFDSKGMRTQVYRLKYKLMQAVLGITIIEG